MTSAKGVNRFTLVELLVVVSIIALLAGLLLPMLMRARQKAVSVACLNKLKQLSGATQMYIDDYDGWFPVNQWFMYADSVAFDACGNPVDGNSTAGFIGWQFHVVAPYLGHAVNRTSTPKVVDTTWSKDWECPNESRSIFFSSNADRYSYQCAFGKLYAVYNGGGVFGGNGVTSCTNLSRDANPNASRGNLSGFRLSEVGVLQGRTPPTFSLVDQPQMNFYQPDRVAWWWDDLWSTNPTNFGNLGSYKQYPCHGSGATARYNAAFVDGHAGEFPSAFTRNIAAGSARGLPYLDLALLGW